MDEVRQCTASPSSLLETRPLDDDSKEYRDSLDLRQCLPQPGPADGGVGVGGVAHESDGSARTAGLRAPQADFKVLKPSRDPAERTLRLEFEKRLRAAGLSTVEIRRLLRGRVDLAVLRETRKALDGTRSTQDSTWLARHLDGLVAKLEGTGRTRSTAEELWQGVLAPTQRSFAKAIMTAAKRGWESTRLDRMAYEAMIGDRAWNEVQQAIADFELRTGRAPIGAQGLMSEAVLAAASMLPAMFLGILEGQKLGGVGASGAAVLAAAAGQAGPQVMAPEEIVTIPTAAAAGYAVGSTYGALNFWREVGAGSMFRDLMRHGIQTPTAQLCALLASVPYALIERAQVGKLIPGSEKALKSIMTQHLAPAILHLGVRHAREVGQEALEEGLQGAIAQTAEEVAKYADGLQEDGLDEAGIRVVRRLAEDLRSAIGPLALLMVPKLGRRAAELGRAQLGARGPHRGNSDTQGKLDEGTSVPAKLPTAAVANAHISPPTDVLDPGVDAHADGAHVVAHAPGAQTSGAKASGPKLALPIYGEAEAGAEVLLEFPAVDRTFSLMDNQTVRDTTGETYRIRGRGTDVFVLVSSREETWILRKAGDTYELDRPVPNEYVPGTPGFIFLNGEFLQHVPGSNLVVNHKAELVGLASARNDDLEAALAMLPTITRGAIKAQVEAGVLQVKKSGSKKRKFEWRVQLSANDPLMSELERDAAAFGGEIEPLLGANGETCWRLGHRFLFDANGRILEAVADRAEDSATLYVDATGRPLLIRPQQAQRASEPAHKPVATHVVFEPLAEGLISPEFRIRDLERQPERNLPPEERTFRALDVLKEVGVGGRTAEGVSARGRSPKARGRPANLWTVQGPLLVRIAKRGGRIYGFDLRGLPILELEKQASGAMRPVSSSHWGLRVPVRGDGPAAHKYFMFHEHVDGQRETLEVLASNAGRHVVRHQDGRLAVAKMQPDGSVALGSGRFQGHDTDFAVVEGKGYEVRGDHYENGFAVGRGDDGEVLLRIHGVFPDGYAELMDPNETAIPVYFWKGDLMRIFHRGVSYVVVDQPATLEDRFGDVWSSLAPVLRKLYGLDSGWGLPGYAINDGMPPTGRNWPLFESLARVLGETKNGRPIVSPEIVGAAARLRALESEVMAGDGPLLRSALGEEPQLKLEAALGQVGTSDGRFVYVVAVEKTPLSQEWDMWGPSTGVRFEPSKLGIFVQENGALRPATVDEIEQHYDETVGEQPFLPWKDLPKPRHVSLEPLPLPWRNVRGKAKRVATHLYHIDFGGEIHTVPVHQPPDRRTHERLDKMVRLGKALQDLPVQMLREFKSIGFENTNSNASATWDDYRQKVRFFPSEGDSDMRVLVETATHEGGHAIAMGDRLLLRKIFEAVVIERKSGVLHGPSHYAETNPDEFFAEIVVEYMRGNPSLPQEHGPLASLLSSVFNKDGKVTDPTLFRRLAEGLAMVFLGVLMQREPLEDHGRE